MEGSIVLLPITTTLSPSLSEVVRTAEVPELDGDAETALVVTIVLPALSVVVMVVWDVGVLEADSDVPVVSSDDVLALSVVAADVASLVGSEVCAELCSKDCVGDVDVVSLPVIVGPAVVVTGSVVGAVVVAGSSLVVGVVVVALVVCGVVESSEEEVVSDEVVGVVEVEVLVVTPVPTTCLLFGMTP